MSLVSDWTETAREVLMNPTDFFSSEVRRDGFGYPLRFAILSLVAAGAISAVSTLIGVTAAGAVETGLAAAVSALIVGPIFGLIGLFIGAGLVHIFVYLLGGEHGYRQTLAVAAYATVLSPIAALLGLIPFIGGIIGLLISLYGIYIYVKGVEIFQQMSTGRAVAAVLLPAIIIFLIVAALAVIFVGLLAGQFMTPPA